MTLTDYMRIPSEDREYDVKEVLIEDYDLIKHYFMLRRPEASDSNIFDLFLWKDCYQTWYFITDKGLMYVAVDEDGQYYSSVPCCKNEDMKECFETIRHFFNDILEQKLIMEVFDAEALKLLDLSEDDFIITRQREYDDYIYDAQKMQTLSGRKYHKKKNHLNAFKKQYEGRYEFRMLTCSDKQNILDFLDKWVEDKSDAEDRIYIEYEAKGIDYVLNNCDILEFKAGGVFIDNELKAFTIGCYEPLEDMVYIPVEKADSDIRGLYTYICSEFLKQAYPDAAKVNREDDMGLEGLRKSKMSYNPIYMIEKYNIIQK